MNNRLKELGADDYINSESITKKVNEKLNALPEERTMYMRQKFLKGTAVALIAAAAMGTTGFAMNNIDLLKQYFGETKDIENYVETPKTTAEDKNFRVTLEKAISTRYSIKTIISVRALNNEAKKQLDSEDFDFIWETSVGYANSSDRHEGHYITSWGGRELKEYRTDDTAYWKLEADASNSVKDGEMIKMTFDFLDTEDNHIVFELKDDIETCEYTLGGQPYGNAEFKLNRLGAILVKGTPADEEADMHMTNAYLRMKDGSIKPYNWLFDVTGMAIVDEREDYNMYKYVGDAYDILDLTQFKSIIVDGIEYDLENPAVCKPIDESGLPQPFELPVKYIGEEVTAYIPLKGLIDGLGGERTETGVIYDGESYELGSDIVTIIDGEKYIAVGPACKLLRIKTAVKDFNEAIENRKLIIIP